VRKSGPRTERRPIASHLDERADLMTEANRPAKLSEGPAILEIQSQDCSSKVLGGYYQCSKEAVCTIYRLKYPVFD
jgi:hypothetical protein